MGGGSEGAPGCQKCSGLPRKLFTLSTRAAPATELNESAKSLDASKPRLEEQSATAVCCLALLVLPSRARAFLSPLAAVKGLLCRWAGGHVGS